MRLWAAESDGRKALVRPPVPRCGPHLRPRFGQCAPHPNGERVGETHKHRWTAEFRDKQAYVPKDITATWDRPLEVWQQFCAEARIDHRGTLGEPSVQQPLPL